MARQKGKRSPVWNHFEEVGEKCICQVIIPDTSTKCGASIAYKEENKGATTGMKEHLKRKHGIVYQNQPKVASKQRDIREFKPKLEYTMEASYSRKIALEGQSYNQLANSVDTKYEVKQTYNQNVPNDPNTVRRLFFKHKLKVRKNSILKTLILILNFL